MKSPVVWIIGKEKSFSPRERAKSSPKGGRACGFILFFVFLFSAIRSGSSCRAGSFFFLRPGFIYRRILRCFSKLYPVCGKKMSGREADGVEEIFRIPTDCLVSSPVACRLAYRFGRRFACRFGGWFTRRFVWREKESFGDIFFGEQDVSGYLLRPDVPRSALLFFFRAVRKADRCAGAAARLTTGPTG